MAIINCSSNCIYEKDGKCTLDHVKLISNASGKDCEFFQERKEKEFTGSHSSDISNSFPM